MSDWLEKTHHWCPKKQKNMRLIELADLCPPCEKPRNCTAWRKYHTIAYPQHK